MTNRTAYNAALRRRGSLSVWFDPETVWQAKQTGKRGRPERFSNAAIRACLTLKVLFGERIMWREPDRETAEIQIHIAIRNRFSALGRAEIEAVA